MYKDLAAAPDLLSGQVRTCYILGGNLFHPQANAPNAGAHVVCGTPGQMLQLIQPFSPAESGQLAVDRLRFVVVEPLDDLLARGFHTQLTDLLELVPPSAHRIFLCDRLVDASDGHRTTAASSAARATPVLAFARDFLREPALLLPPRPSRELTLDGIRQFCKTVHDTGAPSYGSAAALRDLLPLFGAGEGGEARFAALVFVSTRRKAEWLAELVGGWATTFQCAAVYDGLDEQARAALIQAFRRGELRMLIANETRDQQIAAQLQDAPLPLVIVNYDLPHEPAGYLLRVGRIRHLDRPRSPAGGARKGVAISFAVGDLGQVLLENVRRKYGARIDELPDVTHRTIRWRPNIDVLADLFDTMDP